MPANIHKSTTQETNPTLLEDWVRLYSGTEFMGTANLGLQPIEEVGDYSLYMAYGNKTEEMDLAVSIEFFRRHPQAYRENLTGWEIQLRAWAEELYKENDLELPYRYPANLIDELTGYDTTLEQVSDEALANYSPRGNLYPAVKLEWLKRYPTPQDPGYRKEWAADMDYRCKAYPSP